MAESTQHILDRVRRPRVHITYDVEIGDAIQLKELPFVMGILADLSGVPAEKPPRIADRKFVEIDLENFDSVFASYKPRLQFVVDNKLPGDSERINIELELRCLDDFNPLRVIRQIPEMKALHDSRTLLNDLIGKLDGNEVLEGMLGQIIEDKALRDGILAEIEKIAPAPAPEGDAPKSKA
ncbi:MAG: type VI secretion system contractile sheath small subunit [Alphaproteobacteria bacterium]|nr:MAG: type VI secretion system contractile sheath small subunit [Alphaproteobacteria bacterium]